MEYLTYRNVNFSAHGNTKLLIFEYYFIKLKRKKMSKFKSNQNSR